MLNHRLDAQAIGDQLYGISSLDQWGHLTAGIEMVTLCNLGLQLLQGWHLKAPSLQVNGTSTGAFPRGGGEKHLQLGIGKHSGADVTALHHASATFDGPLPLAAAHLALVQAALAAGWDPQAVDLAEDGLSAVVESVPVGASGVWPALTRQTAMWTSAGWVVEGP